MNFAKVLEDVGRFLDAQGFRYGVIGAFALQSYGLARATADLDFLVEESAQPALCAHLESLGYETIHRSAGYSNHIHPLPTLGRLDFVYVGSNTAAQIFRDARWVELLPGRLVRVPRPEHLAAMKVLAMKNDPTRTLKEMADLEFLLSIPGIDEDEVRAYFERNGLLERFLEIKKATSRS